MSFEVRPAAPDDAAGIAAALNDLSRSLYGEDEITAREMRSWFAIPDLVMLVAQRGDGPIVGYADLVDQAHEHRRFAIDLRVRPGEHATEVGAALLGEMETRAAEIAVQGASIRTFVLSPDHPVRRLVEQRGYEVFRHSFQMRIDFDVELEPPSWPDGVSLRTFVPGKDDEAVYEAQQEAFADHFEHARSPYESWRGWAFGPSFDPSLWFLGLDGNEIAGVCLCRAEAGAGGELGFVNSLGVRRPWRRRGLGLALLLESFAELRRRGKRGVGLDVDGLNTTGAVRLYERAGMHVFRRYDQYRKPLPP